MKKNAPEKRAKAGAGAGPAILLFFALISTPSHAGQAPGAFVDVGMGVRAEGMGGAFVAVADDLGSLLWNPAGLASLKGRHVLLSHMKQFDLVPYTCAAFGKGIGVGTGVAAGVLTSGDAVMREHTVVGGYGRRIERGGARIGVLQAGANVKVRVSTFGGDESGGEHRVTGHAIGIGADVGGTASVARFLAVGVMVKDVFAPVQWNTSVKGGYIESVPRSVMSGIALGTGEKLTVAMEMENLDLLKIGGEAVLLDVIKLRGGYRWPLSTEWEKSYTIGFGIAQAFRGDVAFGADVSLSFEELATTSRFGLTLGF